MISASPRLPRVSTAIAIVFALVAAPAAAAGYLKLGGIKGQTSAAGSHRDEIHIESFSWGMSQTGAHRGGGKMHMEDISAAPKDGAEAGKKKGNVEYTWKVEEGESAPPRPTRPTDVTMKRGTMAREGSTPSVSEVVVTKDMDSTSPKLLDAAVKGKVFKSPAPTGSMTAIVPAGTCKVGARYPTAELGTGNRVYKMTDVVVTGCTAASGSDRPMESLSMNYTKIEYK